MRQLTFALALLVAAGCGNRKPALDHAREHDFSEANVCTTCTKPADSVCCPQGNGTTDDLDLGAELALPVPKMWNFGEDSARTCRQMQDILDPLADEYKEQVACLAVNVYAHPDWAKKYRIVTIPTQVFIDAQGKEVFRHVGVYPRDSVITRFQSLGFTGSGRGDKPAPPAGKG
jgi:thioredoxin 1